MAVDDHLPVVAPLSAISTSNSSSSSSSSITHQQHRIQVATDNTSTFIPFPINSRQSSVYVPKYRSRTSLSTTRPVLLTSDTHIVSNKSKSNTSESSVANTDHERSHSQPRFNPILNNPLLNHRKEQPKSSPTKVSVNFSQTTRLCLSSKSTQNNNPHLVHETENNISNGQLVSDENKNNDQQEIYCLDKNKYEYIKCWLADVEQGIPSKETFSKTKRSKNKVIQS